MTFVHYNTVEEQYGWLPFPFSKTPVSARTHDLDLRSYDHQAFGRRTSKPNTQRLLVDMANQSGPDPILLTLFANRFMSVAEAMGRSLQQTSISTNIKERLDFSCALFAPDGDLVANAPFIPIHLGSMSLYVCSVQKNPSVALIAPCSRSALSSIR